MSGGNGTQRDDGYALTMFLVTFVTLLFAVAGLVVDGGRVVAARRSAGAVAASAARLGLQAIEGSATGEPVLTEARVRPIVLAYLAERGFPDSDVSVVCSTVCDRVEVTTRTTVKFGLGRLIGVSAKQVVATVGARQAVGITHEGG